MSRWELGTINKLARRKSICAIAGLILAMIALDRFIQSPSLDEIRAIEFMKQWCRIRRLRVDWEQMLKPCKGHLAWEGKLREREHEFRTDPDGSYISLWDIRPCGEFSRLSIRTVTKTGNEKKIGGDSWRVQLKGPASVAGTVFDHMNGTYEVVFLITEPGDYQVEATLDHSLCDGFTDPPPNWFVIGNAQGKNQEEGVLGPANRGLERTYILKPLRYGNPIWISIRPVPLGEEPLYKVVQSVGSRFDLSCGIKCNFLWDGFGNWVSGNQGSLRWKPFITADDVDRHSSLNPSPLRPDSVLWIYGDSVSEQFFWGIRPRPLCTNVFKWCGHTYNWIYQLKGNLSAAKIADDHLDFSYMRVASEVLDIISKPLFDKNSAILLNAGLHYLESTNFSNYQKTVDSLIRLFDETRMVRRANGKSLFPGEMIWRTTTALNKQKLDAKHIQARRFLTYQRVLLFNAYATSAMCQANVPVIDVHPLTDSYPHGTGKPSRPRDAVHYEHFVFESAERVLENYFYKTYKSDKMLF
ncbi:uncharacterized protein [Montipora capricornis]|uniref:uncharacterized protein isoform X2 n=1 Tax=Montipora capricornis TaxID=246305 RepID=UPI0035F13EB6